jgi:hypothetical protein
MTRKDYELIARAMGLAFRHQRDAARRVDGMLSGGDAMYAQDAYSRAFSDGLRTLTMMLQAENERFSKSRFEDAYLKATVE